MDPKSSFAFVASPLFKAPVSSAGLAGARSWPGQEVECSEQQNFSFRMEAERGRQLWHIGRGGFSPSPRMSTACLLPASTMQHNTLVAAGRSTGRTNSSRNYPENISSLSLCSKNKGGLKSKHNLGTPTFFATPLYHSESIIEAQPFFAAQQENHLFQQRNLLYAGGRQRRGRRLTRSKTFALCMISYSACENHSERRKMAFTLLQA